MVNDVLGGEAITLTYCTLCGSGIAYSAVVNGEPTTFGSTGLLYHGNKLMYDRATGSVWQQFTGEAVIGTMSVRGARLSFFPALLTTWDEWVAGHADTTVLSNDTGVYSTGRYSPEWDPLSINYRFLTGIEPNYPIWDRDDTLRPRDLVLGVTIGGTHRAYPIANVQQERVINDELGGTPVVVLASATSQAARAYERGGHVFAASRDEGSAKGLPSELLDSEGRPWRVTKESLVSVADTAERLERLPSHVAYWLGWHAFHPDTEVYGR